jgi:hypothetical protein
MQSAAKASELSKHEQFYSKTEGVSDSDVFASLNMTKKFNSKNYLDFVGFSFKINSIGKI